MGSADAKECGLEYTVLRLYFLGGIVVVACNGSPPPMEPRYPAQLSEKAFQSA